MIYEVRTYRLKPRTTPGFIEAFGEAYEYRKDFSRVYSVPFVGGTGAGDAFTAGYIAGILRGEDPSGCLQWGSALGASCVRGVGATETVFGEEEAEAFIAGNVLPIEKY